MPELLIEIRSEEIPARLQARAAADLTRLVVEGLTAAGVALGPARAFATPRRLALVIDDVAAAQPDLKDERRGPRQGAPEAAVAGFAQGAGVAVADLELRDTGKGSFHFAVIDRPGRPTPLVLTELLPQILWAFPWPKAMRWGAGAGGLSSKLVWVRPIQSLIVLFGGAIVDVRTSRGDDDGHGLAAGGITAGHRFMAPESFAVADFAAYRAKLRDAFVMLDPEERKQVIRKDAAALATAEGLEVVPDEALLDEVAGLVEWPVPVLGRIDDAFMAVPAEVLTSTMRANQKYFALRDPKTGKMAPRFVAVANLAARDGGKAIVAGNERVLRARLSDAKFFWDQDLKTRLEDRVAALDGIVFHARLGTVGQKVGRIRRLAGIIAGALGADPALADRAALLAKADLTSGVVGEFPEVQGIMGRYYARHDGEDPAVAEAIADHWKPQGPGDACPTAAISVAVALADKLDTLVGFFAIDEKPTGSKDPFALRRAALGVIRLILENALRLPLSPLFAAAGATSEGAAELLGFFADRLKVALREQGLRYDLVEAVFALGGQDDLVSMVARVRALQDLVETADGTNLLAAYGRAANILRIEQKRDKAVFVPPADRARLAQREEQALAAALDSALPAARAALVQEDYAATMAALATLRVPVDGFFDAVTVNADDRVLRENRLKLLAELSSTLDQVADFAKIEGP